MQCKKVFFAPIALLPDTKNVRPSARGCSRSSSIDVAPPPFALRELNNPEDVAPIEQALAAAGLEAR